MRLTNKQLEIVVDEIFEQVSQPIIKANNKVFESIQIEDDEYLLDWKEYTKLSNKIKKLTDLQKNIEDKYYKKTFNDYKFSYSPMNNSKDYIKYLKKKLVKYKEYPSKDDIEKQVILAGNKEIPELIELLVKKLS